MADNGKLKPLCQEVLHCHYVELCVYVFCMFSCVICQGREKLCRTPSGSERKRKRLGVTDGDNGLYLWHGSEYCFISVNHTSSDLS